MKTQNGYCIHCGKPYATIPVPGNYDDDKFVHSSCHNAWAKIILMVNFMVNLTEVQRDDDED